MEVQEEDMRVGKNSSNYCWTGTATGRILPPLSYLLSAPP